MHFTKSFSFQWNSPLLGEGAMLKHLWPKSLCKILFNISGNQILSSTVDLDTVGCLVERAEGQIVGRLHPRSQ